jgi:molecular chaperone GrpE
MSRKKRSKTTETTASAETRAEDTPDLQVVGAEPSEAAEAQAGAPLEAEAPPAVAEPEEEPLQKQLLRLQADFDNYRKRTLREKQQVSQRALEGLLEGLLPVMDHFEMGLATARRHEAEATVVDGFQMVYDQMLGVLRKFNLEPIDAEGEVFNPHLHEAATHVPSEEHDADAVIAQTRRGYKLGDKLLRPAQVVVSSGSPGEGSADEGAVPEQES